VQIGIYDAMGRLVRGLVDAPLPPGTYSVDWDGRTGRGEEAASGVYFCRLRRGGESDTERVVLIR